jgi:hypothetical protein
MGADASGLLSTARKSARSSPRGGSVVVTLSMDGVGEGTGFAAGLLDEAVSETATAAATTPTEPAPTNRRTWKRNCRSAGVERSLGLVSPTHNESAPYRQRTGGDRILRSPTLTEV